MVQHYVDNEIELRLLEIENAYDLFRLIDINRYYLKQWLPWLDNVRCVEDIANYIQSAIERYAREESLQMGIWYKNKLCGIISIHDISWSNQHASIGYWISEEYQGRGIITRSCRSLIDYIFTNMNFNRVEIRCAEFNASSRAVVERVGMVQEGTLRDVEWLYDHYVSHVVYSIVRRDRLNMQ